MDALQPDKIAVVTRLEGSDAIQKRLCTYGLRPGTLVRCCSCSPHEGVMKLQLRGMEQTFRVKDLRRVHGCGL